jgi:hypothetical protein
MQNNDLQFANYALRMQFEALGSLTPLLSPLLKLPFDELGKERVRLLTNPKAMLTERDYVARVNSDYNTACGVFVRFGLVPSVTAMPDLLAAVKTAAQPIITSAMQITK